MIIDFIVGVVASIVASIIYGLFVKKVFGKSNDILTSIYTIYIAFSAFVFVILLTFMLNGSMQDAFVTLSGQNAFAVLKIVSMLFLVLFINVSFVTVIFIIVRQMELSQKSIGKVHKETINSINTLNKKGDKK